MSTELYRKYRPRELKDVIGQDGAISSLETMVKRKSVPHALMLTGPSGCGKTTIGRILKKTLGCGDRDFIEINAADFKGIDTIREIRRGAVMAPISGDCRIWLIDEAGKLTNDAQNAFLKILEDAPEHAYFFLATTDPHKIIKTIHTRCTEVQIRAMSPKDLMRVVTRVSNKEGMELSEDVVQSIVECAEGSARKALVILGQVGHLENEEQQLKAIVAASINKDQAIELARALIRPNVRWQEVAPLLRDIKDDPEQVRYLVLGYSRSVMLGGGKLASRAFDIIDVFSDNFYDSKHAGLAAACWELLHYKKS